MIQTIYCGGAKKVTPASAAVIDTRLPQPEAPKTFTCDACYIDQAPIYVISSRVNKSNLGRRSFPPAERGSNAFAAVLLKLL